MNLGGRESVQGGVGHLDLGGAGPGRLDGEAARSKREPVTSAKVSEGLGKNRSTPPQVEPSRLFSMR